MNCELYLDLISARLDGELTAQEEAELTAHLQECPVCRAIADEMKGMHSALAGLGEVDVPPELSRSVMASIKAERTRSRRRFVRQLTGLAACLVLCVTAWYVALPNPNANPDPQQLSAAWRAATQPVALTDETQPVSNEQRLRLRDTGISSDPSAVLLDSTQALSRFLSSLSDNDLSTVADTYDEEYFHARRLLAVVVQEPSSSISHTISGLTADSVTVLRNVPEAGDCDMALWLILAEVEGIGPEKPMAVELITN